MQSDLKTLGYYDGAIDGLFGSLTYDAVQALQTDAGIEVDGVVGDDTAKAIQDKIGG
jgi:N-acetylmuramoyl-L-alanine amidase